MTKLFLGSFLLLAFSCASPAATDQVAAAAPSPIAGAPRARASLFHPAECSEAPPAPIAAVADGPTCELER